MQATHVEHILTFEIGCIAPTEHLYTDIILPGTYISTKVKFVVVVTPLGITDIFTIHPHECSTIETIKVQEHIFCFPALR